MYYLLTESFKTQETQLVSLILQAVPVQKIYLLGSTLAQQRTESVFNTTAPSVRSVSHYYLLVLIDKEGGASKASVQDKIENNCRSFIPVTAIVLGMVQFNDWLATGHRFACSVAEIAVALYEKDKMPILFPAGKQSGQAPVMEESNYTQSINKVNEFIAGAELYRLRVQYKMAAFMLHQAAEHALHTIFHKATGLHITTHSIDKLVRYCSMVSYQLPSVFPRNNEKNERLFSLLQKAYIDARYNEDYSINHAELQAILQRVQALHLLCLPTKQ